MINDYGISDEKLEDFAARNNFVAKFVYPQDLTTGRDVNFSKSIPFLPIDWEETIDIDSMFDEAKKLEKHYVPHRRHESHEGWSSLVIHGLSSVHTESSHTDCTGVSCNRFENCSQLRAQQDSESKRLA